MWTFESVVEAMYAAYNNPEQFELSYGTIALFEHPDEYTTADVSRMLTHLNTYGMSFSQALDILLDENVA